ncbi:MAG: sialate O-acetylesterase [Planctomycetota bacterium]
MPNRLIKYLSPLLLLVALSVHGSDTVKVYILAGQSNMEGKAKNSLWNYQATDEKTSDFFAHLRDGNQWIARDDVFIKYLDRHGPLTLGYGTRDRSGSEFEFGYVMGEHHDEPVLLIKAAWGGHSLYKLFRSPSNPPTEEILQADLEQQIKKVRRNNEKRNRNDPLPTMEQVRSEYGKSYRNMFAEIDHAREELASLFPSLKGKQLEFAGLFWFQGWNDQYNGAEVEYASNMQWFIKDVRKDLATPELPVVIAMMGQNMSNEAKGPMKAIQDAQKSMEEIEDFRGNVKAVRTDLLVDQAAESLYPGWKENLEQWERTGSDRPYHYLGSAIWFTRIGRECGRAMIELQRARD